MKYVVIFLVLLLGGVISQSEALLAQKTPEELYQENDIVLIGKILDYTKISDRETQYQIDVVEYLKNPQDNLTTVVGQGVKDSQIGSSIDLIFEIGNTAKLYLTQEGKIFKISPYSYTMYPEIVPKKTVTCHFGDQNTSIDEIFQNDLAVKAFLEKHPTSTRYVAIEESYPIHGELSFTVNYENKKESLLIELTQNENGCYRPKTYHYSYDDGIINFTIRNSLSNFTEIINLIKSDTKKIEDFYPKNCNKISLEYLIDEEPILTFCRNNDENSLVGILQNYDGGIFEIQISQKEWNGLFYNCNFDDDLFLLNNGEEIDFEFNVTEEKRIFKIDLPSGDNRIEIIPITPLNMPQQSDFCGSIWGSDSRYVSPRLQIKIGVPSKMVQCNEGLSLIFSPSEKPACVKDESIGKLVERNWKSTEILNFAAKPLSQN
jgi:hypothetical protein